MVQAGVVEDQLARLSAFCGRTGVDAAGTAQAAAIDVTSQQQDLDYVTQTQDQGASTDFRRCWCPTRAGWAR